MDSIMNLLRSSVSVSTHQLGLEIFNKAATAFSMVNLLSFVSSTGLHDLRGYIAIP